MSSELDLGVRVEGRPELRLELDCAAGAARRIRRGVVRVARRAAVVVVVEVVVAVEARRVRAEVLRAR